ncbi:ADP-ribosylglycohydrolase [Saccharopolyspora antimicrobica]|uniref:ADP-ribosylglycohydrolase n=1 Tax=Saccharopolyspora antimicrobica TaxID=455193 RepID=A0A1I5GBM3_9PSEU|nr:ADP-ribosylglycohydrolase family protein [Saccharopolyspora antimicrobica]RKT83830.1 ADP-ribosylglycohydrolase [Saccharopolyspora antimicrobica]SFO33468.1 ADP-ribosylglycohydrolase [Saccharopolyspora antimicrobica]
MRKPSTVVDRAVACLLGGALGDALGSPVEYAQLDDIRAEFGQEGVAEPPPQALLGDATQMALFTGEGYLHAWTTGNNGGQWRPVESTAAAYRRWLITQQEDKPQPGATGLLAEPELYAGRAPGLTSLRALQEPELGTPDRPRNSSKGCGGVDRSAPLGFAPTAEMAYQLACQCAALTHGGVGGWASAGAMALIVHLVAVQDRKLPAAVDQAAGRVLREDAETANALAEAATLARLGASVSHIERLGQGWIGPEALAIGVYCALAMPKPEQFTDALRLAVNHSGHSDSTAAVTGSILGARHGTAVLPRPWLGRLELADVIERIGHDLGASCSGDQFNERRYLGIA